MTLKCIIFDFDGTLADTERDGHRVAFNLAFKEKNLNWQWGENLYGKLLAVTGGKERINFYQTAFLKQKLLSQEEIKDLHAIKTKHYLQLLAAGKIPLREGVENLIKQAKKENITLAISTTTSSINVTALLKSTLGKAAEFLFKVIAAGDIVGNKKPSPDIYLYALKRLSIKAKHCIAIEDSEAGLLSSFQAGIKTIITTNKYTKNQDFTKATAVHSDFSQIDIKLLKKITGENHV